MSIHDGGTRMMRHREIKKRGPRKITGRYKSKFQPPRTGAQKEMGSLFHKEMPCRGEKAKNKMKNRTVLQFGDRIRDSIAHFLMVISVCNLACGQLDVFDIGFGQHLTVQAGNFRPAVYKAGGGRQNNPSAL